MVIVLFVHPVCYYSEQASSEDSRNRKYKNEFNLREEKKMAPDVNVIGNAHRKQINAEEGEYIYISLSHTHE